MSAEEEKDDKKDAQQEENIKGQLDGIPTVPDDEIDDTQTYQPEDAQMKDDEGDGQSHDEEGKKDEKDKKKKKKKTGRSTKSPKRPQCAKTTKDAANLTIRNKMLRHLDRWEKTHFLEPSHLNKN